MSKISSEIQTLTKKRHLIPDEFWIRTDGRIYEVIWFLDRQKPSVPQSYDFSEERLGLTRDGRIIYGFDSGCSCPSPWSAGDFGDDNYHVTEWKQFALEEPGLGFDPDWSDEAARNLRDYLLLISAAEGRLDPSDVLSATNAEVRRYLMKRVGYDRIKKAVKAEVRHRDGTSELLRFATGEQYVKVQDSSTDREYLLYVPDNIKTCREGIAWTFGLSEQEYLPVIET